MGGEWWAPRREGERTCQYLARVLRAVRLDDMAARAELCHFDDYFCPEAVDDGMNISRLVNELRQRAAKHPPARAGEIEAIAEAAIHGEFDGTKEESDEWARSPKGQALMDELARRPG